MSSLESVLRADLNSPGQMRATELATQDFELIRKLIALRKEQGLTQKDVADALGVKQSTIASFERHDNDPKLSSVRRYAHAVNALVAHGVTKDEGQLAAGSAWVSISFTVRNNVATTSRRSDHPIRAKRATFALVA